MDRRRILELRHIYLSRAPEDFFRFTFMPEIFYSCRAVGAIHLILLLQVRVKTKTA